MGLYALKKREISKKGPQFPLPCRYIGVRHSVFHIESYGPGMTPEKRGNSKEAEEHIDHKWKKCI